MSSRWQLTGRVGNHDVVLALLPNTGKAAAAGGAASFRSSYPNLKVALLVGICGGAPSANAGNVELLLGDVVISQMILQHDFGRQYHDKLVPKDSADDSFGRPNKDIRGLIAILQTEFGKERLRESAARHLVRLQETAIRKQLCCDYGYPGCAEDKLFASTYRHKHRGPRSCALCHEEIPSYCPQAASASCAELGCDESHLVPRKRLERKTDLSLEAAQSPQIFVGRIASGDAVMKSSEHRDRIAKEHNILAFETEGAGVWDEIPCIVIKGICNYADSHDSKAWQSFAAATAAAVAKALLERYTRTEIRRSPSIHETSLNVRTRKCLEDLRETDPELDKTRIEQTKGGLLVDSYHWIVEHPDFLQWCGDGQTHLLWIRGDPGKGKTMLLCGIIDELKKSAGDTHLLTFFFCQATDLRLNSATAVLRGLIYLFADQLPPLCGHVLKKYDSAGSRLFEDVNTWVALSEILTNILHDPRLPSTYIVIDALDQCMADLPLLLDFIVKQAPVSSRVKWIVSSRNWPSIEEHFHLVPQKVMLCLELNEESVSSAVAKYINFKVGQLAPVKKYDDKTRDAVQRHLSLNAEGTFLWVASVCQELAKSPGWKTQRKLTVFPPGLNALYKRMMDRICNLEDNEDATICKHILAIVSVVYRPITLDELAALVDALDDVRGNYEALADIVGLLCSFLTLRERTVFFIHQSAKDFLLEEAGNVIFPSGIQHVHYTIFSQSLRVMSRTLNRDIYGLRAPKSSIEEIKKPDPDPLAAVRYSCTYWGKHLGDCDPWKNAKVDLQDGGSIDTFLREKYLNWIEALGILKSLSEGVASMVALDGLLEVSSLQNSQVQQSR
ncbi:hypothetical protein NEMBOFW57_010805 [Staphylotrichum longicolle]|uniref:NACHT domain-containing protein n=1 Tax=Staphylotrichum longicolle TaxID=669026 RepID=A0AAD4HUJ5_9PEZI|nr:hypothetical protein NEMBOFW57_010805 [Staphylotrichum longicolle]